MNILEDIKKSKLYYTSLCIIIIIGIWFRIKGLGKWPLAVDEYYVVKSIENILKYGIPKFEAGGYYERGLLYQYLTAFLIYFGIKVEFAARLIPVISNLVAIPPLFLIAKKISGKALSLMVIVVFALSVWEIEMARFARMYAPFQAIYMWYLYFLFTVVIEKRLDNYKWMYLLNIVSLFIYEGAILITLLNFLPFFWNKRIQLKHIFISSFILLANYFYTRTDFRMIGSEKTLPQIAIDHLSNLPSGGGLIKSPILFFNSITDIYWIIGLAIIFLVNLYYIYNVLKKENIHFLEKTSLIAITLFALLNQIGLSILLLISFIVLGWIRVKKPLSTSLILTLALIVIYFIYWLIYCLLNDSWYFLSENFVPNNLLDVLKRSLVVLFNYPGSYSSFWLFYETIPILTFLTIGFIFIAVYISLFVKKNNYINLIIIISIASFLFMNLVAKPYETRYFFFLYPIILFVIFYAIEKIVNSLKFTKLTHSFALFLFLISFLGFSEDFNLHHLINIDSKEINFRMNYDSMLERHYYRRYDVKTPAEYVNNNFNENDVVLINEMVIEYYLKNLDHIFLDYRSRRFWILSTNEGTKERWTNANLVYTTDALLDFLLENDKTVWFVVHKLSYIQEPLNEIDFYNKFKNYLVYESIDKMVAVYKIPNLSESL
jgi:hypothetical protein